MTNLQVWMTRKEDAKHVPYLPLIPVGATKDRDDARDGVRFPSVRFYPDSAGVFDAEQVVYDLETLLSLGEIYGSDINNTLELTLRMVSQKGENRHYCRGCDVEDEFILEDRKLLNELWKTLGQIRAVGVQ